MSPRRSTPGPHNAGIDALGDEFVTALDGLRRDLRQSIASYQARIEADILAAGRAVTDRLATGTCSARHAADLRRVLEAIDRLELEPARGRRKDVRRLDALVGDLLDLLDTW
jgi:hypothetical protein